jgi:hypothetical protein
MNITFGKTFKFLNLAFLILGIGLAAYLLQRDFPALDWSQFNFRVVPLYGAFVLTIVYIASYALGWTLILRSVGLQVHPVAAMSIWSFSIFGKYIPGKIAGPGYRSLMICVNCGGSPQQAAVAWGLEATCSVLGGICAMIVAMTALGMWELDNGLYLRDVMLVALGSALAACAGLYRPVCVVMVFA